MLVLGSLGSVDAGVRDERVELGDGLSGRAVVLDRDPGSR